MYTVYIHITNGHYSFLTGVSEQDIQMMCDRVYSGEIFDYVDCVKQKHIINGKNVVHMTIREETM